MLELPINCAQIRANHVHQRSDPGFRREGGGIEIRYRSHGLSSGIHKGGNTGCLGKLLLSALRSEMRMQQENRNLEDAEYIDNSLQEVQI